MPARERRALVAHDLGGLRWGAGHVEIIRADGSSYGTVRISGSTFNQLCATLGYTRPMLREWGADVDVPAHTYTSAGPSLPVAVATR